MPSSKVSSQPRDQTQVSYFSPALAGRFFTTEPPGKPDLQSRTRDTDIESKCLDAKGERWCGRNWKIGIDVGGC